MPSPEYHAFIASIDAPLVSADDSIETAREKLEAMHGHPVAPSTDVRWCESGGVRCAWVCAHGTQHSRDVLLLCHGGAFIAACDDGYLFYAELLSRHSRARVLLVDYRLAPTHRYPAALEDCTAAYKGLTATDSRAENVVVIGDSCGGGIALAMLTRLRDERAVLPAGLVSLSGWFDLEAGARSATDPVAPDPFADAAFTRARGRDYVGDNGDLRDPFVSPVYGDFAGLPPILLQVGQIDLTRDDALRVADRAGRAGVDVRLEIWPAMVHGFQGLAAAGIPEGAAALESAGRFVRESTRRARASDPWSAQGR